MKYLISLYGLKLKYKPSFFPLCRRVTSEPAVKAFVESMDPEAYVSRLDLRDAFYGGRVETFSLYQEAAEDEAIR